MTKRTCFGCGVEFDSGYSIYCNVCHQTRAVTRAMEKQADRYEQDYPEPARPVIYTRFTEEDKANFSGYTPPTFEENRKIREVRNLDLLFKTFIILFPIVSFIVLWMFTSGWFTFFSFIAVLFVTKYLATNHWYWQVNNFDYLFK